MNILIIKVEIELLFGNIRFVKPEEIEDTTVVQSRPLTLVKIGSECKNSLKLKVELRQEV